ncbi:MAG: MalY/PatB family protein [Anaerolineae bacterium]
MADNDYTDYDFDRVIDRRHSDSIKWRWYGDALPLWVADMDFPAPEPVLRALRERIDHGIFGYAAEPPALRETLCAWLWRRFNWQVDPAAFVFIPGVVTGFNVACRAFGRPGEGVLVQTPVYPPILDAPANHGLARHEMQMARDDAGRYSVDPQAMAQAIAPNTRLFILCNPQNPTGRAFTPAELAQMAEISLRYGLIICSDEIHCDLVFSGAQHTPIAALDPAVASRTITLMAPSKTFNIPSLGFSLAIIEDKDLRAAFKAAARDIVPHITALGYVAALAAYRAGEPWLAACLRYLQGNRDYLAEYVRQHMPGIHLRPPEATYLAWLDCRGVGLAEDPAAFFLRQAGVALNEGKAFGRGGEGFVRLNFACPRATLTEALARMATALAEKGDAG